MARLKDFPIPHHTTSASYKALYEYCVKLEAVAEAARIVLPLYQERYANTTKHEGGFDVFGSADKMLTDALEQLDEGEK